MWRHLRSRHQFVGHHLSGDAFLCGLLGQAADTGGQAQFVHGIRDGTHIQALQALDQVIHVGRP